MNWGHAETSEAVWKLGYTGALVARFLAMTTSSDPAGDLEPGGLAYEEKREEEEIIISLIFPDHFLTSCRDRCILPLKTSKLRKLNTTNRPDNLPLQG